MKVKELIENLQKYNPEAKVMVIVDDQIPCEFEIWYGGKDGVTKETCDSVDLSVYINGEIMGDKI